VGLLLLSLGLGLTDKGSESFMKPLVKTVSRIFIAIKACFYASLCLLSWDRI